MAFKTLVRSDLERVFPRLNAKPHDRSVDGVAFRVNGRLTGIFVEQFEQEHNRETPTPHFINAVIAAVSNMLAGTLRYCIQGGHQREVLKVVLNTIREQVEPRLEAAPSVPVFHVGLDPDASTRGSKEGDRT